MISTVALPATNVCWWIP